MKRERKNGKCALTLILAIALALQLASCQTSPRVVTETVVPPLTFPAVPDPVGFVEVSEDGETVIVATEFWVQLAEYMVDVDAIRKTYNLYRETYGHH